MMPFFRNPLRVDEAVTRGSVLPIDYKRFAYFDKRCAHFDKCHDDFLYRFAEFFTPSTGPFARVFACLARLG